MTTTTEPRVGFLSLPLELREHIYAITISDSATFNTYARNPPPHGLLLVNRQVHDEYAKIYYGSNIFHLDLRSDQRRIPNTSSPKEWKSYSLSMLSCIREVMIHLDLLSDMSLHQLDARLAMAPNIEILHFVLFCTGHGNDERILPPLYLYDYGVIGDLVKNRIPMVIPCIKLCCKASTLPNLLRVVLHADKRYGNETTSLFMQSMKECSWVRSISRSLISCENAYYVGEGAGRGPNFSEHVFELKR